MKKKSNIMSIIAIAGIMLAVVVTMGFYTANAEMNLAEIFMILTIITIIGFAAYVMYNKLKAEKRGLPPSDELAKKVSWKAGYYTWIFTIWLAVATQWFDFFGLPELLARHVVALIVLGSGMMFFISYFWFNRKGDV